MLSLYLKSVGLIAPGLSNWSEASECFKEPETYVYAPVAKKLDTLLPANERRRATRVTQLALAAAQQISDLDSIKECLQIFSSANGDVTTFHQISLALAMDGRPVSPTRFHNSVHNAPAGYWSIATGSQTASTSLTAYSDSFSAGLLEAAVQVNASDNSQARDCLLVCYDEVPPAPFRPLVDIKEEFACALRLGCENDYNRKNSIARLDISLNNDNSSLSQLSAAELEPLRLSNPQAMALPLLEAIALQRHASINLPYFEQSLKIEVTPVAELIQQ